MSTMSNGDRWSGISTTIAHWSFPIVVLYSGAEVLYWFYPSDVVVWSRAVLFVLFFVSIIHLESTRLCIKCMTDVPVDAAQKAQKYWLFLKMQHLSRKTVFVSLFLILAAPSLLVLLWDGFDRFRHAPLTVWVVLSMYGARLHHRLRPWCPYCRDWGDGGDTERVPDPTNSEKVKL